MDVLNKNMFFKIIAMVTNSIIPIGLIIGITGGNVLLSIWCTVREGKAKGALLPEHINKGDNGKCLRVTKMCLPDSFF